MEYQEKLKAYITGFALSIFFTVVAFFIVLQNLLTGSKLTFVLVTLAILQALVQLIFFLHLKPWGNKSSLESKGVYSNLIILFSATIIILILVVGTLWIMNNLNHNMTPHQMDMQNIKMENIMKHQ